MSIDAQSQASVPPAPGLDAENGVTAIVSAGEHGLELEVREPSFDLVDLGFQLALVGRVLLGELGQDLQVGEGALQLLERLEQSVERLELLNGLLGFLLVVPEAALAHAGGQLIALSEFVVQVKESPVAG